MSSIFYSCLCCLSSFLFLGTHIGSIYAAELDFGSRQDHKVAITFDADMTPGMLSQLKSGKVKTWYNSQIINILNKEKIPATIFLTGMWAQAYPEVAKNLAKNPLFEIGNHSYSHPGFTTSCFGLPLVPTWGKSGELEKSQKVISEITGIIPKYFRFPGGCHSSDDVNLVNKFGLTVVGWDDASGDPFNNNLKGIIANLKKHTQNGSILVFHLQGNRNAPQSASALAIIIPYLRDKGFQFVKISDLL